MENLAFDKGIELQDAVLETQHDWLTALPVSAEIRWEIFERLSIVTGKLLDALQDPEKFNELMSDPPE